MSTIPAAVSVDKIKTYLSIPAANTSHDVLLGYLSQAATEYIAERLGLSCGLTVNGYDIAIDVEEWDCDRVRSPVYPLQSVAALTNGTSAVAAADFYTKSDRWIVLKGDCSYYTMGKQKVTARVLAGWDTVPELIQAAISASAGYHFNRLPKQGIASERIGAYAISLARGEASVLSADGEQMLSLYFSPIIQR